MNSKFETAIGIEVHAQILTESKMFCSCSAGFGAEPNTSTCPVCLGMPGSLPRVNRAAVILGMKAARALECDIPPHALFARKNYFYPDLPKGYQISMYRHPVGMDGRLEILTEQGQLTDGIGIERVHLEEDSAKLIHNSNEPSIIDFNRAGIPLIEIVTKPEIRSSKEAVTYLKELRRLLRFLGVSNASMDEGSFRCEINLSVKPSGQETPGARVEIKNLNSFRAVERSIEYEINRHVNLLKRGEIVEQATLGWDEKKEVTVHLRSKEKALEYRYFPEPDLPLLMLLEEYCEESCLDMEDLPARRIRSLIERFGVPPFSADLLIGGSGSPPDNPYFVADFFEETVHKHGASGTQAVNLITGPIFEYINRTGITLDQANITPKKLAEVVKYVMREEMSSTNAKKTVLMLLENGGKVTDIVAREGLAQISAEDEMTKLVREVIEENENIADQIRSGKLNAIDALIGAAMKKSRGQANPKRVNELLNEMLVKKK